jgi:hypothetical protein
MFHYPRFFSDLKLHCEKHNSLQVLNPVQRGAALEKDDEIEVVHSVAASGGDTIVRMQSLITSYQQNNLSLLILISHK